MIEPILGRLSAGEDLDLAEMADAVDAIMAGNCSEPEIAVFLTALRAKGETVAEVAGAASAMRRHMTPIRSARDGLIDTCGTGGDGSGTFNISTAAAFVTAAAGVPVAKHGNRAITSKTGSADVLAAMGVNIDADVPVVERCLEEVGLCFCFAPLLHQSMKHVAAVRRKLGVPTIFNLLGPLSNPASAPYQLIGVGQETRQTLIAEALVMLGTERSTVVRGDDGLDEVTLEGPTHVLVASARGTSVRQWIPEDFGLRSQRLDSICVEGPAQSAAMIQDVLSGVPGVARDIVVANAAAALWTAGKAETSIECAAMASDAIDRGAAAERLAQLVRLTNG